MWTLIIETSHLFFGDTPVDSQRERNLHGVLINLRKESDFGGQKYFFLKIL